jgi:hypothetical protein
VIKGIAMKNFKIPSIPQTTNKCIRFPNDVIEDVENAIRGKNCTFSAFVIEAVKVALSNLEESYNDINEKSE